jgi:hypothetical protein
MLRPAQEGGETGARVDRGNHHQSIDPSRPTNAAVRRSPISAYSSIRAMTAPLRPGCAVLQPLTHQPAPRTVDGRTPTIGTLLVVASDPAGQPPPAVVAPNEPVDPPGEAEARSAEPRSGNPEPRPQGMVPGRERRRTKIERAFMRMVATGGSSASRRSWARHSSARTSRAGSSVWQSDLPP